VERPGNLISASSLVQETFELLNESGGRVAFTEIASRVFHLNNAPDDLAASLIADLVQNDPRFLLDQTHLAVQTEESETRALKDLHFVVFDVEAIGGRSVPTRIIELGACHVHDGQIISEFESLVNPQTAVPSFISGLTGITDEMLIGAPTFAEIAQEWLAFAGDAVLVAHNSMFDLALLNREIARVFPGCRMRNPELCTVQLARRLTPSLDNHNLDALAEHFAFEITQRHRAAGDARATARLLLHLLDKLEMNGVKTLSEARNFRMSQPPQTELALTLDS
jgi:DNA polymerase III epsilon subunit family exonuclease